MDKNSQKSFDAGLQAKASSPAARELMTLMQSSPDDWQKAQRKASQGDYTGALEALSGMLKSQEAQALLKQLEALNG